MVTQPLNELGGGETIREIHQETPFSLVALTSEDLTGTTARVRAKTSDGSWGAVVRGRTPLEASAPIRRRRVVCEAPTRSSSGAPRPSRSQSPGPPRTQRSPGARRKPNPPTRPARVGIRPCQRGTAVRAEPQRDTDQPTGNPPGGSAATAERGHPSRATPPAHHQPGAVGGRRRGGCAAENRATTTGSRRGSCTTRPEATSTPPPGDSAGDRQIDLRVPHPHPGLVRHRLQRDGRQVRTGIRGSCRRHDPARRARTPVASTTTPGVWPCSATSMRCPPPPSSCAPPQGFWAGCSASRESTPSRGGAAVGRRVVHQVRVRRVTDAADDLHPPRRRQHRVPGQRGIRVDARDPEHRRAVQRPTRTRTVGRDPARRRHLREVGFTGRDEQLPGPAHLTRGFRAGLDPLRHLRTRRCVLVSRERRRTRHRRALQGMGGHLASSGVRWAYRPAGRSPSRCGSCRTSSTAPSTSTARRAR